MFNFNYLRRAFRASKYGKVALVVLFVGLIAASGSMAGNLQSASPADAAVKSSVSGELSKLDVLDTDGGVSGVKTAQTNNSLPAGSSLTVSCSGSPTNPNLGETVTWRANVAGGSGGYAYSWIGNGSFPDGATTNPVLHSYIGGPGLKTAQVTVTSGGATATAQCSVTVIGCAPLQYTAVTANNSTHTAKATATNPNPAGSGCDNMPIGLASYKTFVLLTPHNTTEYIATQELFDNTSATVPPGQSRTLTVSVPTCNYQVDFFNGTQPKEPPFYGPELMSWTGEHTLGVCGNQVQLSCQAQPSTTGVNKFVSFTATGGNGTYSWFSPGGNPSNGAGSLFSTRYATPGVKTATVTSGGQTATCPVTIVETPQNNPPFCSPSNQTANVNQNVFFNATGGNGLYSWSVAGGGNPSTGAGSNFSTKFSTPGTKTITLTSNGQSDQCLVVVQPVNTPDISCSPLFQNVNIGEKAFLTATGGNGAFNWTASGGSPSTGIGPNFSTTYGTSGSKLVLVSDTAGHTAQCNVQVNQVTVPPPFCSPDSQNAEVGESVFFSATGGNGSFVWSAGSGSPTSGTGSNFNTVFFSDGTHVVNVTSNGVSDSCIVHVEDEDDDDLTCSPSNQDADIGDFVTFRASGGSGSYRWTANEGDADPDDGTGRNFTTRFFDEGRFDVRVRDSEGRSATCRVRIEEDFEPSRPRCSPSSQTANVNEQVEFFANGGTGNYEWDADDGSPRSGFGSRFTTSFDSPGRYEVELESNGRTDTCEVRIVDNDDDAPFCSPSTQSANVNDFVTFSATGGNGSYFWSTSADGNPSTGNGSSFGTRFLTPGTKFVIVSSNGRTSQCVVQIGSVLGASTVVTGPTETAAAAVGLGFLGALGAYGAVYRERSKKALLKLKSWVRR